MIPQVICHYTKRNTALGKILSRKELLLNQMYLTNDPRETKDWSISKPYFIPPKNDREVNLNALVTKVLDEEVPKVMKNEWKVVCFTFDPPISPRVIGDPIDSEYASHPSYAHPRMWAQYAENHKGICILFDGNKLDQNLRLKLEPRCIIYPGEVKYNIAPGAMVFPPLPNQITLINDIEKLGPTEAARKYVLANYPYFFLRKNHDWEAETEYRWLVYGKEHAPEFIPIEGAIKSVLVGVDFPDRCVPSLRKLCKDLRIPAGTMDWTNGFPTPKSDNIYKP